MNRRDFLKDFGLTLAAAWAISHLPLPRPAEAGAPILRLALLADAHLKSGDPAHPEARLLARAVAEIRAITPAPDLVLFAGDLAHDGNAKALALGREILSDLHAPLLLVRGEGDGPAEGYTSWNRLFSDTRFAHHIQGINIIGIDTAWRQTPRGPAFALGESQCCWLAAELSRLDPALPLIILSHAPLTPIFQPWQQWTADAPRLAPLLARFRQVVCLHGHVHEAGVRDQGSGARLGARDQGSGVRKEWSVARDQGSETNRWANFVKNPSFPTKNQKPETKDLPIPATAWPLPSPLQGTPHRLTPGLAPHGCGWSLMQVQGRSWTYAPRLWEAV